jgi:hypothetical protein
MICSRQISRCPEIEGQGLARIIKESFQKLKALHYMNRYEGDDGREALIDLCLSLGGRPYYRGIVGNRTSDVDMAWSRSDIELEAPCTWFDEEEDN